LNYWPAITVAISLILILFFRRLDKRRINFNKFKRYAEKLSSDFNDFLTRKKDELGDALAHLNEVIRKAENTLVSVETAQGDLIRERTDIQKIKLELDGLKREYDRFRSLKDELTGEVENLTERLPSIKKVSKRLQKIGIDIVENEKALKNFSVLAHNLEKRVQERTEQVLSDVTGLVLEEAKGTIGPLTDEFRQNLEMLKEKGLDEITHFKSQSDAALLKVRGDIEAIAAQMENVRENIARVETDNLAAVEKRIEGLVTSVEAVREKIETLENETTVSYLQRAEDEYRKFALQLEEYSSSFKDDIFKRIEENAKDLSTYISRLEGRVQSLLQDVKSETDKYAEGLSLKAKGYGSELDVLKNRILTEINEEANKNMLLIKPITTEMNEKLIAYKDQFNTLSSDLRKAIEEQKRKTEEEIREFHRSIGVHRESIIQEMNRNIDEALSEVRSLNDNLEQKVKEAAGTVSGDFVVQLKKYEKSVQDLEGRIGDLKNIARAGQAMIEERIETVFQNYRPEIETKIRYLQEETEGIIEDEKEKIVQRITAIIDETDMQLQKREVQVASVIAQIGRSIEESQEEMKQREEEVAEQVSGLKIEARKELIRELESLKALFEDEKKRSVSAFSEEIADLGKKIGELNERVEEIQGSIEKRIGEAVQNAAGSIKQVETSYLKTEGEMKERVKAQIEAVNGEIESLRTTVDKMKNTVLTDIDRSLAHFKDEIEKEFAGQRETAQGREKEIQDYMRTVTLDVRAEIESSQKHAQEFLQEFEHEAGQVQAAIEKKLEDIEQRIRGFEKDSVVLKRALKFKERVEKDIDRFSDILVQLKEDKKDILSLQKIIQSLKREEGDISAKVRQLKSERKLVQEIAKNAEQAIGLITLVDEKIKLIESERDVLEKIEAGMYELENRYKGLEDRAGVLKEKEKDIEVSIETIAKTREFINSLEQRTDFLKDSFSEIKDREEDLKKRLLVIEDKTGSLMGNERRIDEVLSRFKEMDSLVIDIEERTKQLQNTREWLARTESRLQNLTREAERLAGELERTGGAGRLKEKSRGEGPSLLSREAESKVKTVLTLFEQQWTIPEICKVTKMSRGEVELILELNNRG